ncbi:MAG: carbohydrate ABC transporter permease [Clostridia bacterium]|nr:carbohydrate ABC transporter permease [Clostridia bacterium]
MENNQIRNSASDISVFYYLGKAVWSIVRAFFLICIAFVILYPLVYMLSMSFRSAADFYDVTVVWIPKHFTLENYKKIIFEMGMATPLLNTVIISALSTVAQIFIAALTGYGFARFKFKGSMVLFVFVVITIMMPAQMINIPNYLNMRNLDFFGIIELIIGKPSPINLVNTPFAFIVPALFGQGFMAGLFILIFRMLFQGMPVEFEEAATIDGCGYFGTYMRVMLPNSKTALIICSIFSLVWYWSDYYGPYVFLTSIRTLSVYLMDFFNIVNQYLPSAFKGNVYYTIPLQQAACVFSILPLLVMFLLSQKFFRQGLERSGIVG